MMPTIDLSSGSSSSSTRPRFSSKPEDEDEQEDEEERGNLDVPPIATCATRGDGYIERYSTFQNIVMKYAIIGLIIGSVFISGCASDVDKDAKAVQKQQQEKNPEVGMTKAQILAMYGKTDNIQTGSDGETWIYTLNAGEAYIPFNFGYHPKTRVITFDQDGKVSHWSYSK